jgi:hypothetical protein
MNDNLYKSQKLANNLKRIEVEIYYFIFYFSSYSTGKFNLRMIKAKMTILVECLLSIL